MRRPGHVRQVAPGLPGEHPAALLADQVPLVVDQYEGPPGVDRLLDDAHVLVGDRLGGVQEDDGDLGLLDGALGAQDRVVVGAAGLPHTTADPGGVHEDPLAPVELENLIDRVAGGARHLVDHHAGGSGDGVEQGGLADVRPSHQGDAVQAVVGSGSGDSGDLGQDRHGGVQDLAAAAPVQGGERVGLAEPQAPQGGGVSLLGR